MASTHVTDIVELDTGIDSSLHPASLELLATHTPKLRDEVAPVAV